MPHCIIEYSTSLETITSAEALVETVHQAATDSLLFDPEHIKTRSVAYQAFSLGDHRANFLHVTVRLHQGRSQDQKKHLTQLIVERLCTTLPLFDITVTAEAVDIDTATYAKTTLA